MSLRSKLAQVTALRVVRECVRALGEQFGFGLRWIGGIRKLGRFTGEYQRFKQLNAGTVFDLRARDLRPCLNDCTATTPVDPTYFLQDTWAARRIVERRPVRHVDVASSVKTMAVLAQVIPVTFVDIRPVELEMTGFTFVKGTVLELPFADRSVASLSSLCVIEHIGLGRYGDPLDAQGSAAAAAELARVLASGGDLYVSVPVDDACRVYFNAHRAFTPEHVMGLFPELQLIEERYIYGCATYPNYDAVRGFGTGLYHFRRA